VPAENPSRDPTRSNDSPAAYRHLISATSALDGGRRRNRTPRSRSRHDSRGRLTPRSAAISRNVAPAR